MKGDLKYMFFSPFFYIWFKLKNILIFIQIKNYK